MNDATLAPASAEFAHLFEPITIGSMTMPNRLIMSSMHTGAEDKLSEVEVLAAYFAERARGGAGLMITGGYAPNRVGWLSPMASKLTTGKEARAHRTITDAVHQAGGRIALQILHAGRYAYHPLSVSASAVKAPINPFRPRALTTRGVWRTIADYARAARLAQSAGYDAVEIMGSEGYLINQFLAPRTNRRTDEFGGTPEKRRRFPVEIVRAVRAAVGPEFPIVFRLSVVDLVEDGQTWDDTVALARELEAAGVSLFNSGIGWHESRVPTIVTSVPRAAFTRATGELRPHLSVPIAATNRINMPHTAEEVLASGQADLVSMARPWLADPEWALKAREGRVDEINTCIACNQACLDHTFARKRVSCLVNPRAVHETELVLSPTRTARRIAVVGSGPAGLAAAVTAARRGHEVDLYEARDHIGGQFDIAARIPGKEEFAETIRYFTRQLEVTGVRTHLSTEVSADDLAGVDHVIVATGVAPRVPSIPGVDHPSVMTYAEAVRGERPIGRRVAVVGAGGIGVDVSEFLTEHVGRSLAEWERDWGVADPTDHRAGLTTPRPAPAEREVWLLQRKSTPIGIGLGRTTGWVHRAAIRAKGVHLISGARYDRIDDEGLHVTVTTLPKSAQPRPWPGPLAMLLKPRPGKDPAPEDVTTETRVLPADTVILCAGQESVRSLADDLAARGVEHTVVGGADVAAELDAKRAIKQGTEAAARV